MKSSSNLLLLAHIADGAQCSSLTSTSVRQPMHVSMLIPYDLRTAAECDNITELINNGSLSKCILASIEDLDTSSPCTFCSLEQSQEHSGMRWTNEDWQDAMTDAYWHYEHCGRLEARRYRGAGKQHG